MVKVELTDWKNKYLAEVESHRLFVLDMNTHKSQEKNSAEETWHDQLRQLERKLAEEVAARKASEKEKHELQRKTSVQDVDVRQLKTQMDQMDAQYRNEVEKVRSLTMQIEQETQKRALLSSDFRTLNQQHAVLKNREKQLDLAANEFKDLKRSMEDQLQRLRAAKALDDNEIRDLKDQLEAEQHFSSLYKQNAHSLEEEIDARSRQIEALENERPPQGQDGKELEWVNSTARLQDDLVSKDNAMYQLKEQYDRRIDELVQQKEELERRLNARTMEGKRDSNVFNLNGFAIPGGGISCSQSEASIGIGATKRRPRP
ncbi:putative Rho-associated protein kinase 2 [Hypsibius exemplaris]|uniref:Rho-associated protein kinase 2 n=1 Tax=Hypsibius exemplaris TaxID=2072580 RepID=A0A9X6NJJ9_HYPEX|nr:putative Rho-associated protein kinase 2 [Hypsibius exemplaris]